MTNYLIIDSKTWKHENNGLFDYNSKELIDSQLLIHNSCNIYLNHSHCYVPDPEIFASSVPLLNVTHYSSSFQLSLLSEDPGCRMWEVVKSCKSALKGHVLNEGQWLRLGKIRLLVKQICISQVPSPNDEILNSFNIEQQAEKVNEPDQEQAVCRICLNSIGSDQDPLISPCKCAGTMSKVHVSCLKQWINSKFISRRTSKIMSFYSKDLLCELCKKEIPPVITFSGCSFSLIDLSGPNNSTFLLLEEYSLDRMAKNGLHVISLKEGQNVVIGRSQESDLKISDITVSRKHCRISLVRDQFYLNDNDSKFGTLVKMRRTVQVRLNMNLTVQIGRIVLKVQVKSPFRFKDCCQKRLKSTGKVSNATQADGLESILESAAFMANRIESN